MVFRPNLKKVLQFADVITRAALSSQLFKDPEWFKPSTSRLAD